MPSFVGHIVAALANNDPDRTAVMDEHGRCLSRRELDRRSNRLAHALLGAGLRPGDRIAVWMEDVIECVETYVAAAKASLVAVPIGKLLTAAEGAFVLSDVDARAVVCTQGIVERLEAALAESGCRPERVITVGSTTPNYALSYADALAAGSASIPTATQHGDQHVLIGYTSGTTGFPKGALIGEHALRNIIAMSATARRLRLHGLGVVTASLSFPAVLTAEIFTHLYVGSAVCVTDGWDVHKVLDLVTNNRATYMYLPTPAIPDFLGAVRERSTSVESLRTVMHSGSKASPDRIRALHEVLGGRFIEIWGLMENSGGPVTATTEEDYSYGAAADIYASAGRPVPLCAVHAVDSAGVPLATGEGNIGELTVSSPALFNGYWNNPEATGRVLRDGWYFTGDLGWTDESGYVYVVDRRKDLIVSGGMNVYPSELERVLATHADVEQVVVVGAPHERWGRTPVAIIVARAGSEPTEHELVAYCRRFLASYKKPTRVLFRDSLPHNASGKVIRRELEEWAISRLAP